MPAMLTPIDHDLLAGLRRGEEAALERLFRERYDSLLHEAVERLDEPSHGTRIVEQVFINAWDRRAQFETPDALDRFLHDGVREGAARDRARHATLHHHPIGGVHNGAHANHHAPATPLSADAAWTQLIGVLHAPPPDAESEARVRHDISRHLAAEHVAAVAQKRSYRTPIIIAIVAIALAVPILRWLNRASADAIVTRALASQDARVVLSPVGQRAQTTLRDGSAVMLQSDSKLRIPKGFGAALRAIRVEGAGTVNVAAGQELPLEIRAGSAVLTAASGAVAVRAFPDESRTVIRVLEGSPTLTAGSSTRVLAAGTTVAVGTDSTVTTPTPADAASALAWVDGRVLATDVPLRDAIRLLTRWYGLELTVNDETLLDRRVTVDAPLDSPRQAIASIETSGNLAFGYVDKVMVLRAKK